MTAPLSPTGLADLHARMARYVDEGRIPGIVTLVASGPGAGPAMGSGGGSGRGSGRADDVHVDVVGTPAFDDDGPLRRDAIFRIASITKPIVAAAAMTMVDDGTLALDQPVDDLLPELAARPVLRTPESELDDTVALARPITVEDLLSFRVGVGCVMSEPGSTPYLRAEAKIDLQSINGPPWPPTTHDVDSWMAGLGSLPLLEQPGTRWRYNTGSQLVGVLLARAAGRPLPDVVHERICEPLGMVDTGFVVPADQLHRLTSLYRPDPGGGAPALLDGPHDSWWSRMPSFPDGSGGLVSTVDDVWRFAAMLHAGGIDVGQGDRRRILSDEAVALMTTDRLPGDQHTGLDLFLDDGCGWGLGMEVPATGTRDRPMPWGYGWDGGSGTAWRTNPSTGVVAVLLTQLELSSPEPPPVYRDFWAGVNAATGR